MVSSKVSSGGSYPEISQIKAAAAQAIRLWSTGQEPERPMTGYFSTSSRGDYRLSPLKGEQPTGWAAMNKLFRVATCVSWRAIS